MSSFFLLCGSCKSKSEQNKNDISQEDVTKEIEQAVDTTVSDPRGERKYLIKTYASQVEKAEVKIKQLKENIELTEKAVKQDYQKRVKLLESQIAYVKQNIRQLRESSEERWQELSAKVDTALVNLDRAIKEAKDEFQNS
jgi:hypothetical protein